MIQKRLIGMILLIGALLCACGHTPDPLDAPDPEPAEIIYNEGMKLYKKKSWAYAFEEFQKVRTRYPLTEWGLKAEIKLADCLYYQQQYAGALTQYQEFARLHPTYEYIDYIHYQMGMCYYEQLCEFDRDQSFSFETIKQFRKLISLFPNSPYVLSAREKIEVAAQLIAAHWVYIGDFYYTTKCYSAALDRYREAIQDHFTYLEEPDHVFFMLGKTYLRMNKPEHARQHFARVALDYPDGAYAGKARMLAEDSDAINELDELTFDQIIDGLNPFYECEGPIDPDDAQCKVKVREVQVEQEDLKD